MLRVSHYIGLSGIGGVQRNFIEYINAAIKLDDRVCHEVFTHGEIDSQYPLHVKVHDVSGVIGFFTLIVRMCSKKEVVHIYNRLASFKIAFLLTVIPVSKLVLHERGAIWNVRKEHAFVVKMAAKKSNIILANSRATKSMLVHKFGVLEKKIKVIYNGVSSHGCENIDAVDVCQQSEFCVGFLGRLEPPKGAHILLEAMRLISDEDNIKAVIAGDGALIEELKIIAGDSTNIKFIGRVNNPYSFLKAVDVLVVPSLREPLGNVCLEAGLCYVPVIAANVDGLSEIIEDGVSGELINPLCSVSLSAIGSGGANIPEKVIDPATLTLRSVLEINPQTLADRIKFMKNDSVLREHYAKKLNERVTEYFSVERYVMELHEIYFLLVH